ncbi:unnamed protein product [Ectocarpus sp. 13 AM-2016]
MAIASNFHQIQIDQFTLLHRSSSHPNSTRFRAVRASDQMMRLTENLCLVGHRLSTSTVCHAVKHLDIPTETQYTKHFTALRPYDDLRRESTISTAGTPWLQQ